MQHDEFSNFRSSIEWPDMGPDRSEEEGAFQPLSVGAMKFMEVTAKAHKLEPICESPIEVMLGARLAVYRDRWNERGFPKFKMVAQHKLAGYRYDFAILSEDGKLLIAIECDGAEFHSTPEQLANDRAKDAAVRAAGADIFRFSGSDIFQHDDRCVAGVFRLLCVKHGISQEQWNAIPDAPKR